MTKAEIVDSVYERVGGFSKKEAAEVVESVFDTMKEVLARGEKIKISGFGNFVVRHKKERVGRNPQTGAPIPISARRVLTFKPSQVLKGILNPHRAGNTSSGEDDEPRTTAPPGAVSPGAVSPGAVSSGAVSSGAVSSGAVSSGAVPSGEPSDARRAEASADGSESTSESSASAGKSGSEPTIAGQDGAPIAGGVRDDLTR